MELESIIRPIVEGQVRSFMNDHADRYPAKKHRHLATSLGKRIVNDICAPVTVERIRLRRIADSGEIRNRTLSKLRAEIEAAE